MEHKFLLTLCIPTYNRAKFLDVALERLMRQYQALPDPLELEIIVSDNCSSDSTPLIVNKYLAIGLPLTYVRNAENLGPDGNFIQCFKMAQGKYVWLLGDDDFLKEGALNDILSVLASGEYGLVHLQMGGKGSEAIEYRDNASFIGKVSHWITYISANIVNTRHISVVEFERYTATFLGYLPLYMLSALVEKKNILLPNHYLEEGADVENNGGYNFFQVFVENYLNIWSEFIEKGYLTPKQYEKEKLNLLRNCLTVYIRRLLVDKNKNNFDLAAAWKILLKHYAYYPYFYYYIMKIYIASACTRIRNISIDSFV